MRVHNSHHLKKRKKQKCKITLWPDTHETKASHDCELDFCHLYLTLLVHETLQHFLGVCKLVWVPSEVALPICVLNIQPDEVIGDVVLVKAGIN